MIFALLTLFSALTLAAVAGWFSIVGIISIYAGAPMHAALVMGVVIELAKLVTVSWIYRNWVEAKWSLRGPMIYSIAALMLITSISVFGFLTKSHLEQGAATLDNSAKVERLDQQITREKSVIADDEKVIAQLDTTINSYLGKDRADRAVTIRRSQAPQRKQLREDIDASQKKIDSYSDEKFKLQSEVRALKLEVGPIRYIAELFYSGGDETKNVETAVKLFTLLIVSTLDPLAVILLIAANHTLLRIQREKKKYKEDGKTQSANTVGDGDTPLENLETGTEEILPPTEVGEETPEQRDESHNSLPQQVHVDSEIHTQIHEEMDRLDKQDKKYPTALSWLAEFRKSKNHG
jgi:hypothetical protein